MAAFDDRSCGTDRPGCLPIQRSRSGDQSSVSRRSEEETTDQMAELTHAWLGAIWPVQTFGRQASSGRSSHHIPYHPTYSGDAGSGDRNTGPATRAYSDESVVISK